MIQYPTRSTIVASAALLIAVPSALAADSSLIGQETSAPWRASKLAGVPIYGPQSQSVGKISDVLLSKDGKSEYVVVGVGGFLGIGEKDVAIPYDQVKFIDQPMMPPADPAGFNNAKGGTAMNAGLAPATSTSVAGGSAPSALGAPIKDATAGNEATSKTRIANGGMSPAMAHSTAYPDHGVIDMTAEQLKNAPAFKFAS